MNGRTIVNGFRRSIYSSILCRRAHDFSNASQIQRNSSASTSPLVSKLRRILQNEIQYQHDYAPPQQPPMEFNKFMVEDRPGEQWITLRGKSAEHENIKIEATMFDGSVVSPKPGDDDTEDIVRLHISMLVDVWKEGETDLMEFVCSAWPDSMEIQKVYVFRHGDPTQPYMGPNIKCLGNKLRTELYKFLNTRGVNDDLSRFLHQYMMNKDRMELIQWLRKLQIYFEN